MKNKNLNVLNGGEGSGDFGHAGNPPHVGGSEPVGSRHARGFKSKSEKAKAEIKTEKKEEKTKDKNLTDTNSPFGEGVEIEEHDKKGYMLDSKNLKSYKKGDRFAIVDDWSHDGKERFTVRFHDGQKRLNSKTYSTKRDMEKAIREHLSETANKETKALETKTDLNTAETKYNEVLKKYKDAEHRKWKEGLSNQEYYKAWEDSAKIKKELTTARREYAESIMSNFEKSDDTSYEDKQNARRERYENLAGKAQKESDARYQSWKSQADIIPLGQPIIGQRDASFRRKLNQKLDKAFELSKKSDYYEDKAKSVGKAGISADDKNAILKLAQKYKSGIDSAEKRRIIDRVISIHQNSKIAETSKASESFEKLGFNLERNSDANRLQLKFNDIPDASVRSILKSNGFRWSPTNKAWQRQLGANSEYALKRVVEKLSDRVENCLYKHEYIEY